MFSLSIPTIVTSIILLRASNLHLSPRYISNYKGFYAFSKSYEIDTILCKRKVIHLVRVWFYSSLMSLISLARRSLFSLLTIVSTINSCLLISNMSISHRNYRQVRHIRIPREDGRRWWSRPFRSHWTIRSGILLFFSGSWHCCRDQQEQRWRPVDLGVWR